MIQGDLDQMSDMPAWFRSVLAVHLAIYMSFKTCFVIHFLWLLEFLNPQISREIESVDGEGALGPRPSETRDSRLFTKRTAFIVNIHEGISPLAYA
jgi:hypothetical protein